jgi:hypothetical protein
MARTTVLSYGAGQDSWALLLMYVYDRAFREAYAPGEFLVAMSDTGAEHPETLDFVAYTRTFCAKHGIEFTHITPDLGFHTGDWRGGLFGMFEAKSTITSQAFPMSSCTASLKIVPFYAWLNDRMARLYGYNPALKNGLKSYKRSFGEEIDVLIGFAVGEESRAGLSSNSASLKLFDLTALAPSSDPAWMQESIRKRYPLIDLGFDRAACRDYAGSLDQPVPSPSNCVGCHWKSDADVLWTLLKYPDLFSRWEAAEARKLAAWGDPEFRRARQRTFQPDGEFKNLPVGGRLDANGEPILLRQRAERARTLFLQDGDMTPEAMLAMLDDRRMKEGHGVRSRAA